MRLSRLFRVAAVVYLASALLPAAPARAQSPLKVVATFSILADLVQNVGGDKIALTTLVGAGSDSHTYEPSPRDSATLADAILIFENGAGFEGWLDDIYVASGSKALRVAVTEGVTLREGHHHHEHEHEGEMKSTPEATAEAHEHEHEHGEYDPHVWHDVSLAMQMVENIRAALVKADAANAETYNTNAAAYTEQLKALDADIKSEVAQIPEARRKIITTHDTFAYFGARYGFVVDGALGVTTEAADPSAGEIAALIEEIRKSGVPAIFADNVSNPQLMAQIAQEAGVMLAPPLYTDALGEAGSNGDTYLKLIRYNMATLVAALK